MKEPTQDRVKKDTKKLNKVPRHLAIILSEENVHDLKRIAKLICWSLVIGIHFITIFDGKGIDKYLCIISIISLLIKSSSNTSLSLSLSLSLSPTGILKSNSNKLFSTFHHEAHNFFGKDYINYDLKFQKSSVREPHFYDPQFKINSKVINLNNHTHALNETNYPNNFEKNHQNIAVNSNSNQDNSFHNHTHSKKNKTRKSKSECNNSNENENENESNNYPHQTNINDKEKPTTTNINEEDISSHKNNNKIELDQNPYLKNVETDMDTHYVPTSTEYFLQIASWEDGRTAIVNLTRSLTKMTQNNLTTNGNIPTIGYPFRPATLQRYLCGMFLFSSLCLFFGC
jgi:hypothetical protein